ncbi:MAG TPA: asparagine synthase (glutamine-hydrolyzing) [Rhizomicrobium sp.]|nr:asparagine synthase (glutamine-hydrolyzing) [Rhizomicrobium sp.]
MCGIFGWLARGTKRGERETLARLTDRIAHRGPDGSGYWMADTRDGRHQIALGNRRLSIIDIGGGAQPMWSADETITLTFNGEIYNYIELRDELVARGHSFRTHSDTEVVVEAYREWGTDAVAKFRGMFGFALWDLARERLLLARDAFGKKPLFLAEPDGVLIFSSEIEPVLHFPGFSRALDERALPHYFLNRYVPGPLTFFRGVRKVPPGCFAVWEKGALTTTRYFTPPVANGEPDVRDMEEAARMLGEVFDEAVRIRMRSDAPYGAYLSGGLDSSSVVGAMTRRANAPVKTFSVGFAEKEYSELEPARLVASHFGTDHAELIIDPESFMDNWEEAALRRGAPVTEASDIPILLLSKMAARTVKMVLTGEGADEMLGGYPKHRAERWIGLYQRLTPRLFDRAVKRIAAALPYRGRRARIALNAAAERDVNARLRLWFGGMGSDERDALTGGKFEGEAPPDPLPFASDSSSTLRRTLLFDQASWLPDNLLERGDRMMMAGSIEGRMPFMDVELARVAARFSDGLLTGGRGGKTVLRKAAEKFLPAQILARRKVGFRVPFNEWFRSAQRNFVRDMLQSEASRTARICDREALQKLVQDHMDRRSNNERALWSLVNLELFFRVYKLEPSVA